MKQYYHKYTDWEDYKNGMYNDYELSKKEDLIIMSVDLLKDKSRFYSVATKMVNEWRISAKVNLTNKDINRRSWIGQAACCFNHGCPELLTRIAWSILTEKERILANKVADKVILEYERQNRKIYKGLEKQGVLF